LKNPARQRGIFFVPGWAFSSMKIVRKAWGGGKRKQQHAAAESENLQPMKRQNSAVLLRQNDAVSPGFACSGRELSAMKNF
jgi:hypothetical protein